MTEKKGKYGDLLNKAKSSKPDSQQSSEPDNQKNSKSKANDPEVNLCVRVPKSQRQWWAGQAKMHGTTMTDVIKAALTDKFGSPPK